MRKRPTAYRDERTTGEPVGKAYKTLITRIRDRMRKKNNDFTFIVFGETGSGKSTLIMQTHKIWINNERLNIDVYGFDEQSWAQALDKLDNDETLDFVVYDEGNKSRRRSMSADNTEFIDLLFNIRYKNWCKAIANPSADYLDRVLIEDDVVNAFIYIYATQKRFYFFTRAGLHKMLKEQGNIKGETIKTHGKEYALLDSYFTRYTGDEWAEYDAHKKANTNRKLRHYINKRKNGTAKTPSQAAEELGVSNKTIYRHLETLTDKGLISREEAKNAAGMWRLTPEHLETLRQSMAPESKKTNIPTTREDTNGEPA